ncbi:MAG: signal peptidase I [Thermoleophilia bacterium]
MRRIFRDVVLPIAVALALAFVVQAAVAKPYEIPSASMYPTIKTSDRVIANRLIYRFRDIERGDIVVFHPPQSAVDTCGAEAGGTTPYIKRVIGLPGDTVEVVANGPTLVNGTPFTVEQAGPNPMQRGGVRSRSFKVPAGHLFVMGDNRPDSCDSHQWMPDPYVPISSVIGQAEVTYWPITRWGFLD